MNREFLHRLDNCVEVIDTKIDHPGLPLAAKVFVIGFERRKYGWPRLLLPDPGVIGPRYRVDTEMLLIPPRQASNYGSSSTPPLPRPRRRDESARFRKVILAFIPSSLQKPRACRAPATPLQPGASMGNCTQILPRAT